MEGLENIPAPQEAAPEANEGQEAQQAQSKDQGFGESAPKAQKAPQKAPPKAEPKAPALPPEMREITVNGKKVKLTQKEIDDYASMSYRANEKFNEAKTLSQKVDKIISTAKSNPIEALMDPALGLSKDQIRDAFEAWYAKEYIEPETLSPQERELNEYKAKVAQYEEQQKKQEEAKRRDEEAALTHKQREYLQKQLVDALESSKLPKQNKEIVKRMAFYMRQNLANGWEAPMDFIVNQVKQERQQMFKSELEDMSVDEFLALHEDAAEKFINKIREYDIKRLREQRNKKQPEFSSGREDKGQVQDEGPIDYSEVNRRLMDMRRGKFY